MPSLVIVNCIGRVIAFVDGRGATHSISASHNAETRTAPGFPRSPMPSLGAATVPDSLSASPELAATRTAPGPINQINKTLDALAEKPGAVNAREGERA